MASRAASNGDLAVVVDGSFDFSGGVNSNAIPTIQSEANPNGLRRNQLAWLDNGTVRNGALGQRAGINFLGNLPAQMTGNYQGKFIYVPPDNSSPFLIYVVGGVVWQVNPDDLQNPINVSAANVAGADNMQLPSGLDRVYFCQAQEFLIIQANDGQTLPLFFDGNTMRRSIGITTVTPTQAPGQNEIPAAGAMDYYMGRLWYSQGPILSAGDITGGPSGTLAYGLRDAILNVTENPLCIGGDGFAVELPIRAVKHSANLNSILGQGMLYIFTAKKIYALQVPVTRQDWIGADANNQPLMTVIQIAHGAVNDRSVVAVNGDLFYQTFEPAIRSLVISVRNFQQWGNVPISVNEDRVLSYNDRNLLRYSSGCEFDNRLLQLALPYACPVGAAHKAIVPLNFDTISTLETQLPPVWEGMYEGINALEIASDEFGGLPRCFITAWSDIQGCMQLWELTEVEYFDEGSNRVMWYFETPAYTWGREFTMKELVSAEIWIDRLWGEAMFKLEYRPDGYVCWLPWHEWKKCTQASSAYPTPAYPEPVDRESYAQMMAMPAPPYECSAPSGRPSNIGFQFQCRITIKGFCRVRGIILKAQPVQRSLYEDLICTTDMDTINNAGQPVTVQ